MSLSISLFKMCSSSIYFTAKSNVSSRSTLSALVKRSLSHHGTTASSQRNRRAKVLQISRPQKRILTTTGLLISGLASYWIFREKPLSKEERVKLRNLTISSATSPLTAYQVRQVKRALEKHLGKSSSCGYSKVRKKDPSHQKLNLPHSLFIKSSEDGCIDKIFLSVNKTIQEGSDKRVQSLCDISGKENKVLLKAKRTLIGTVGKENNPFFETAKLNIRKELKIQKGLNTTGIAVASVEDGVSWRRSLSEPSQTAYIMDEYLGDLIDNLSLAREDPFQSSLQLLKGLKAIHDKNIIHKDLKPENILVSEDGKIGICDFGVSLIQKCGQRSEMNPGTFGYSPPEIFTEEFVDGRKVDIFSMGCIFYALLLGSEFPWISDAEAAGTSPKGSSSGYTHVRNMKVKVRDFLEMDVSILSEEILDERAQKQKNLLMIRDILAKSGCLEQCEFPIPKTTWDEQRTICMLHLTQQMLQVDPALRPSADSALKAMEAIVSAGDKVTKR